MLRPNRAACLAVTAFLLVASAGAARAQTMLVRGTVHDSATGALLDGVRVETRDGAARWALTDDHGRYRLLATESGPVTLRLTRIGYRPAQVVGQPGAAPLDVILAAVSLPLDPVIVTATRTGTASSAAPTAATVVDRRQMQDRVALSPVEQVRETPGMDVASKGLIQHAYAVRGERGSVSGALLTLTDFRNTEVPSLNLNIPYLMSATAEDIDRIEIVRGPGAALYGPGADRGVMHILTRSPFESPGTTFTLTGGGRELFGRAAAGPRSWGPAWRSGCRGNTCAAATGSSPTRATSRRAGPSSSAPAARRASIGVPTAAPR